MITLSSRTARATLSGSDLPDGLATPSLGVNETTAEVHKGGVTGGRGGDAGNAQGAKDADPDHRTESNRRSHHVPCLDISKVCPTSSGRNFMWVAKKRVAKTWHRQK